MERWLAMGMTLCSVKQPVILNTSTAFQVADDRGWHDPEWVLRRMGRAGQKDVWSTGARDRMSEC